MNIKYILGSILAVPLLPVMYFHGKKIKALVPELPEAKGIEGKSTVNSKSSIRLLTIGESTIAGVGVATHNEGFTGTLANELSLKLNANVQWKVYARSGYTAKRVREKIIPKITEQSTDIIVIGLGGNDAFTLSSPAKWKLDINELIVAVKEKFGETPIIFTNMPPIKEFPAFTPLIKLIIGNLVELLGEELNKLISAYSNVYYYSTKITMTDWMNRFDKQARISDFFSDGVHPSKLTYQIWAKDIAGFLLENKQIANALLNKIKNRVSL